MNKKQVCKQHYVPPHSIAIKVKFDGFLCKVSGQMNPGESSDSYWEYQSPQEGDNDSWFGSTSEVAP